MSLDVGDGQGDAELRSTRGRVDLDLGVVVADQAPDDIEAQPRALADLLGGEERLEHARADVIWNARPVVYDADDDALAVAGRGDVDLARLGNGIERVVDQVRPDLIELAGKATDAGEVGLDGDRHRDGFPSRLCREHRDRVAKARRQVDGLGHRCLIHVREALDGHHETGDPPRRLLNLRCDAPDRARRCDRSEYCRKRRATDRERDLIERFERDGRFGKRSGDVVVDTVRGEPVGDVVLPLGLLDRREHAMHRRRDAGRTHRLDGGELRVGQLGCAQRQRRLLGLVEALVEQRGAAFYRRRRVVQLVRQASGELAERDHLLVLQAARREVAAAIDHRVDEDRRDRVTLADHRRQVVARDRENLRGFLRDRVRRRADQARVGEHPRHITGAPLHGFVPAGAAVQENGDAAAEHDEERGHGLAFGAQHLSFEELAKRAVCRQPRQFFAWRSAECLVSGESIEEVRYPLIWPPRRWPPQLAHPAATGSSA